MHVGCEATGATVLISGVRRKKLSERIIFKSLSGEWRQYNFLLMKHEI